MYNKDLFVSHSTFIPCFSARDGRFGYKTGPGEMAKLTPDETKELEDLRTNNLNIK